MAKFQASLKNPALTPAAFDPEQSTDCLTITFNDYSNYTTNTDSGHALANFTQFRRVLIIAPGGSTYNFSSIGDGDALIAVPSTGNQVVTYSVTNGDGVYTIVLTVVPTWNDASTYELNGANGQDVVYYNGKFYKSKQNANISHLPTDTAWWTEITEEDITGDSLNTFGKYWTTQKFMTTCSSELCLCAAIKQAVCVCKDNNCNDDILCENKCFLRAAKIDMLLKAAVIHFRERNYNAAQCDIDLITTLCDCADCGCKDC